MKFLVVFLFPVFCFGGLKKIDGLKASFSNNSGEVSFLNIITDNKTITKGKFGLELQGSDLIVSKNKSIQFRLSNFSFLKDLYNAGIKGFYLLHKAPEFKFYFLRAFGVKNDIDFSAHRSQFICASDNFSKGLSVNECVKNMYFKLNWAEMEGSEESSFFEFVNGVFDFDKDDLNGKLVLNDIQFIAKDGYFEAQMIIEKNWRPVVVMNGSIERTEKGVALKVNKAKIALFSFKDELYEYIEKFKFGNVKVKGDKILIDLSDVLKK